MKFSIKNAHKDISYFNNMVAHGPEAASLSSGLGQVLGLAVEQGLGDQFLPSLVKAE